MSPQNTMGCLLLLSVTLVVAMLPGLQAGSLEAVNLLDRGMLTAATKDPLCKDQLTSCDGCNQIRTCVKIRDSYYNTGRTTTCDGDTPWCAEENGAATCVATAPTDSACNKPKPADFLCTQTGYFPDVVYCNQYFICVKDPSTGDLVAYSYNCNAVLGGVYDAATARCKVGRCLSMSCPHPDGATYQLWSQAPWIYATCLDNDPKNALVAACPKGQSWDGENCVQACHEEGRFPAVSDTTGTKFVECVAIDNYGVPTLSKPVLGECPVGTKFNAAKSICM